MSAEAGDAMICDPEVARQRLARIHEHPSFAATLAAAMASQADEFEAPDHVEQSIYGGFPSRRDQKVMVDFHRAPWSERCALLSRFDDRRYQEFGERIIYAEAPNTLPPERLTALKAWHRERHTEDEVPWFTIKKAQDELVAIKDQLAADETALVAEIDMYLGELVGRYSYTSG